MMRSKLHPRDLLVIGLVGLRTRRVRSALTAAGIAIGIAAMVAVLAISESSQASLLAKLDKLGTNLLTVSPGTTLIGSSASLPLEAPSMIARVEGVEDVSTVGTVNATVLKTDLMPSTQTRGIRVVAADLDLLDTLHGSMAKGIYLNAASAQYPAVVLGSISASRLGIDSAGCRVWLGGRWFAVVGILDPLDLAPELDSSAMIGYPIAAQLFDQDGSAGTVYVRTDADRIWAVDAVLAATANPENPGEVSVSRPSDVLEARAAAADAYTALFLGLGAVALIVGGVGIANVMLMAVLERRSEIGLRRALGATRNHIAMQFVAEALTLAVVGGGIGVGLGMGVAIGYALLQGWAMVVPALAVGGGLGAAIGVGVIAGFYPSLRASRVSPTEALRGA